MKRWLITTIVLLLLLLPFSQAQAVDFDYQAALQEIAKAEGCNASIVIHQGNEGNGFYVPKSADWLAFLFGVTPHSVHVILGPDWTHDMNMYVGMHEIGHCIQDEHGWLGTYGMPYQEWDADIQAQRMAEKYGISPEAGLERFIYRYHQHGNEGDPAHSNQNARALNTIRYMSKRVQGA